MGIITVIVSMLNLVSSAPGYWMPEDTLTIEPEAVVFRNVLLEWSAGLKSFSGSYEVYRSYYTPPKPNEVRIERLNIEYRFQDDCFLTDITTDLSQRKQISDVYAYVDGAMSLLVRDQDNPTESSFRKLQTNSGQIPLPYSEKLIFPPPVLFGHNLFFLGFPDNLRTIEDFLSVGYSCVKIWAQKVITRRAPVTRPLLFLLGSSSPFVFPQRKRSVYSHTEAQIS